MKFYAVKSGRQVGVYTTWPECKAQVDGYKGARYKSFNTMKEALDFIGDAIVTQPAPYPQPVTYAQPTTCVQPITQPVMYAPQINQPTIYARTTVNQFKISNHVANPETVLYVDGGHNKQTGADAWGCVVNGAGVDLIPEYTHLLPDMQLKDVVLPVGNRRVIVANFTGIAQQNNGAELLSLVAGLRIALTTPGITTIFSDSDLCIKHWSISLGSKQRQTLDPNKVAYIDNLIALRREFTKIGGSIVKISGDDNLADLGYHK